MIKLFKDVEVDNEYKRTLQKNLNVLKNNILVDFNSYL